MLARRKPQGYYLGFASLLAVAVSGCASADNSAPALALPKMPDLSVASIGAPAADHPVGTATEIYARVARGANTCWFVGPGPAEGGPLKKDYIYHAEADAPSRGGKAEIVIHQRDVTQPNPRGAKAYRVHIEPDGTGAALKTENLKMPEAMATAMTEDVNRWAKGDQGCAGHSTVAGWSAPPPPALSAAPALVKKTKAKAKPKVAPAPAAKPAAAATP